MGRSDGVNSDIYLERYRLFCNVTMMKKAEGETLVKFVERIRAVKKNIDGHVAAYEIPENHELPNGTRETRPIIEGGERTFVHHPFVAKHHR